MAYRVEAAVVTGELSDELVLAALEVVGAAAEGVCVETVVSVGAAGVLAFAARRRCAVQKLTAKGHGVKDRAGGTLVIPGELVVTALEEDAASGN